jgi:LAGLIDADG endonuclease
LKRVVKIYSKTILVRGLFIIKIFSKYIIIKINPKIVKYYYKISNQPITKLIKNSSCFASEATTSPAASEAAMLRPWLGSKGKFIYFLSHTLLLVGISETIRAKKNDISILCLDIKHLFTTKSTISPAQFLTLSLPSPCSCCVFLLVAAMQPPHQKFATAAGGEAAYPTLKSLVMASVAPFSFWCRCSRELLVGWLHRGHQKENAAATKSSGLGCSSCFAAAAAEVYKDQIKEQAISQSNCSSEASDFVTSVAAAAFSFLKTKSSQQQLADNLNKKIYDNHNNEISLEFKQWFAGLTDGDGYIYVNKDGYVGYELTLNSMDEKVLRILQNKFGGNVHARAGLKAIRYRSQNKNTVYKIIQCLNGLVINNIRLAQLHKACLAFNIPIKDPIFPDNHSAYISGLLDADGYINMYKSFYNNREAATYRYQLTIAISNKSLCNIDFLSKVIGGKCYFDKKLNGHYKWVANSKLLHLKLYDYFLKYPPKTVKRHRTFLIKEFHDLNDKKAYLENDMLSVRYKI